MCAESTNDSAERLPLEVRRTVVLAVCLALAATTATAKDIPFASQAEISTAADAAKSVVAADIDGDGDLDVLSASSADDTVAWYENDGNPQSVPWAIYEIATTAGGANSVFVADINGDGVPDVLSANRDDNTLTWYEHGGDPKTVPWTAHDIPTTAFGPEVVFAADMDGDGDLDVLSASYWDANIFWYENTAGDGSSWSATDFWVEQPARWVFAEDMDGDGDNDILFASNNAYAYMNDVAWFENLLGDGSSWSAAQTIYTDALAATSVFAADIDGDGDMDALSSSFIDDTIAWYENIAGDGSVWSDQQMLTSDADGAHSVFAADMDGDGDLDVLSASEFDNKVAWYENIAGDGSAWSAQRTISTAGSGAKNVFVADVDDDGDMDVLAASSADDTIAWYENQTIHRNAVFLERNVIATGKDCAKKVAAADIDGDGDLDALSASLLDNTVAWYENDGTPGGIGDWTEHIIRDFIAGAETLATADIDNDGDIDVVSAHCSGMISWFENSDGAGTFTSELLVTDFPGCPTSLAAEDVDNDGDADVLATGGISFFWYENLGGGSYDPGPNLIDILSATDVRSGYAADIDGDGDLDALSASADDGVIAWYANNGAGSFGSRQIISTLASGARSVFAADVDGDGDLDVLSASYDDDKIAWYVNDGTPGGLGDWIEETISVDADGARSVYAADMDADGDLDVVSSSWEDDKVAWYENIDGTGLAWSSQKIVSRDGDAASCAIAADLDGDGDQDVLASWANDDKITWHENRGGQFALPTANTAPSNITGGQMDDVLKIVTAHNGRAGDEDFGLLTIELLLEESPGDPLTTAEADDIIAALYVYLDDGSGEFESISDTEVASVYYPSLDSGVLGIDFSYWMAEMQTAYGSDRAYFVVPELTADAALQNPRTFRITHLTESTSAAVHGATLIPLTQQYQKNVPSTVVTAGGLYVVQTLPMDNEIDVYTGANVYVFFSEPVNPATVNASTFRLRDAAGTPVSADISLDSTGLQATLDPLSSLALDTIYTVNVTSGVQNLAGSPAVPHTSRFRTDPAGGGEIPLPQVSEGTIPVSPQKSSTKAAGEHIGWSLAYAGDLDSDGYGDFITGAPGFVNRVEVTNVCARGEANECQPCASDSDCGGVVDACVLSPDTESCPSDEVGEVLVYLGDASDTTRITPDIAYRGNEPHDRVGVAVAGNFDFNGDGTPDILIGAEQVNTTDTDDPVAGCDAGQPCGAGKVYLIYFDPADYDLADTYTDRIDLGRVGNPSHPAGAIDGVVFHGAILGDRAGRALAGGGALGWDIDSNDLLDDIVIGAPGASSGDGEAYVIFSDGTLSASEDLGNVGGLVSGRAYRGASNQGLGHAVVLPGDITGSAGDDIALGAPMTDPLSTTDAGMVYVVEGGGIRSGAAIYASTIEAKINGTQAYEQLGFALAGGGDNRHDGQADLLIGSPFYDAAGGTLTDAGRVVHVSARLPAATVAASAVGDTITGVIWTGDADSDGLGFALAGVGDVTGNNYDDIALGAPYADPQSTSEAGMVYLIEGETESTAMTSPHPVGEVGSAVAGLQLAGVAVGEHAGFSTATAGDLDGDDDIDFVVGAPDKSFGPSAGTGAVYMVLENELEDPGNCDVDGCTIVDLSNGAQLAVPAGSLTGPTVLAVAGILDEDGLASRNMHVPAGKILAGAADYDDEDQGFSGTDPTADIPIRPEVEDQVEAVSGYEDVYYFDLEAGWLPLGEVGLVAANPHYPSSKSVQLAVDPLHVYAVFLADIDGDGVRDTLDCAPHESAYYEHSGEVTNLRMTSKNDIEWDVPSPNAGTSYDVMRGALDELAIIGSGLEETCRDPDTEATSSEDLDQPATAGEGFYYLVRGKNPCGIGTYGMGSPPAERNTNACP